MRIVFGQRFETDAANRFLEEHRRKEPLFYWLSTLFMVVFLAIVAMIPAALLFAAINSWSPIKVPLWFLFLPGLFGITLWTERQNDLDQRMALWRALVNILACVLVAYVLQVFLSTNISDRVLRSGVAARQASTPPFWACVLVTWTFVTYAEVRWGQAKEEHRLR